MEEPLLFDRDPSPHKLRFWSLAAAFGTDAYDLFIAGAIIAMLHDELSTSFKAMIAVAPIFGAIIGQMIGKLGDLIGRKTFSLITISLVIIGALLSAFAPNFKALIAARFILGLGIGGEYPAVATIAGETSGTQSRGKRVLKVFSMQGFGALAAPLSALLFYGTMKKDLAWRFCLGIAAIPATVAAYLRYKLSESNVYQNRSNFVSNYNKTALAGKFVGTAGSWLVFDIVFYATGLFSPVILKEAGIHNLIFVFLFQAIVALCALPGYWTAIYMVDRVGRKKLQLVGFLMMGLVYFVIGLDSYLSKHVNLPLFIVMYALSFFFANAGPNSTTFILPVESFPTKYRSMMHGLSAASGKTGAFLGGIAMANLLHVYGIAMVFFICSALTILGLIITLIFTKETKDDDINW